MPQVPGIIKGKKLPGIRFYVPAQVAYELAVAEHKRIRMKPEDILSCLDYYSYFFRIILAILTDPKKSMKLMELEHVDRYRDLLIKGTTPNNPVSLETGEVPGLRALLPLKMRPKEPDAPEEYNGQLIRRVKRMFKRNKNGRVVPVRILLDSTWEELKGQCIDELEILATQIKTFIQLQLREDARIKQEDFEFITQEGSSHEFGE